MQPGVVTVKGEPGKGVKAPEISLMSNASIERPEVTYRYLPLGSIAIEEGPDWVGTGVLVRSVNEPSLLTRNTRTPGFPTPWSTVPAYTNFPEGCTASIATAKPKNDGEPGTEDRCPFLRSIKYADA